MYVLVMVLMWEILNAERYTCILANLTSLWLGNGCGPEPITKWQLYPHCSCLFQAVKKAILEDLVRLGKAAGLKSFEQVKDLYIHTELFSVENGLLTPTLKAKRAELVKVFQKQIEALYSSMQE